MKNQQARERIRSLFFEKGVLRSQVIPGKEEEGSKYRDYFAWEEPLSQVPSHRLLAMRRGEKEEVLSLHIAPPEEEALTALESMFVKGQSESGHAGRKRRSGTAINACSRVPWKRKHALLPKKRPMKRQSASSPTTCATCSWRLRWDRNPFWP